MGLAVLVTGAGWSVLAARPAPLQGADAGRRFYLSGVGIEGQAVPAVVQGDVPVSSTAMPCVNCHRRSGYGSSEGPVTAPSITGAVLFRPVTLGNPQLGIRTTGPGTRPAYDEGTLLRALRGGVDPNGRPLSPTMPRYAVDAADAAALSAYLRTLSSEPPAGVTGSVLHLATITSPGVDRRTRDSMLAVLRAFVRSKNSGTRHETRRREHGPWDMKTHYENYRDWQLDEWSLRGDPEEWRAQLDAYYARQPVFALVSGAADGDWTPVHEFCEDERLPCIFPQTVAPAARSLERGFYSLYFSRGLSLEAAALARFLSAGTGRAASRTVLQVLRCGGPAAAAARQLTGALGDGVVRTRCVEPAASLSADGWKQLLGRGADVVVVWLRPNDVGGLAALAASHGGLAGVDRVFLSASLDGDALTDLPAALAARAFLLDPFVAPADFDRHALRALAWARSQRIELADARAGVNAFFAVSLVSEAVATPGALASREYFVEQFEHMVGRTPQPSAYPSVGLAPARRFAATGCAILQFPATPGGAFRTVAPWFVPDFPREDIR